MNLDLLGLQIASPNVHPRASNFRPPSWPPPPDWAPILDAEGNPVCRYSDPIWPLDVWAGKSLKLNFGDGKTRGARIDTANARPFAPVCRLVHVWTSGLSQCGITKRQSHAHQTSVCRLQSRGHLGLRPDAL